MSRPRKRLPAWIKIFGLAVLSLPLFTPILGTGMGSRLEILGAILALGAYATFVWIVIASVSGLEALVASLSVAFVFGVTTILISGAVSKLAALFPGVGVPRASDFQLLRTFMITIISVPLALFSVQCFSAASILERLHGGRRSALDLRLAVALRVFQHLAEVFPQLVMAWREEHPSLWLPRHRVDWSAQPVVLTQLWGWFFRSAMLWSQCLLMHCMRIVPVIEVEIGRLEDVRPGGVNDTQH